jgi:hypothetical protein
MSRAALEAGYWRSYRQFYRWGSIFRSSQAHDSLAESLRHLAYAAGWKKFEPLWDWVIRLQRVSNFLPLLESILAGFVHHRATESTEENIIHRRDAESAEKRY